MGRAFPGSVTSAGYGASGRLGLNEDSKVREGVPICAELKRRQEGGVMDSREILAVIGTVKVR